MDTRTETHEAALERVCATTIAEKAFDVDRSGSFPAESLEALSAARESGPDIVLDAEKSWVTSFEGMGLRGNDSSPVSAAGVRVPRGAMLGADGQGFEIMMNVVLPVFAVLNAACSNGLMAGALRRTVEHATRTRHTDTGRHSPICRRFGTTLRACR